jgi:hypothetical protein
MLDMPNKNTMKETLLYTAATEAIVSDASGASTFEKMLISAIAAAGYGSFADDIKKTEREIRKEFELKCMPNAWRSSKSVVLGAWKMGVAFKDNNGAPYGKTALQNLIKRAKTRDTPMTEEECAKSIINMLLHIPKHLDPLDVHTLVKEFLNAH